MTTPNYFHIGSVAKQLQDVCHSASKNAGWWSKDGQDLTSVRGEKPKVNVSEKLMLCVSEAAEAMEGARRDLMDDKLPHRKMLEVELADMIIRGFDLGGGLGLDVGGAIAEKMAFNAVRPDHKLEARAAVGGKAF